MSDPFYKKKWFMPVAIATMVAGIAAFVFLNKKQNNESPVEEQNKNLAENDSLTLIEFYKKEEAKPFINPPLEGVNIPYANYKVIAENGATLIAKSGSKISIPKHCFSHPNGDLLKGEVEVKFREFHEPIEFFVAGIPMTYDSAGVRYQFESAGMVEIKAYQNGKQVAIAPKKSINVELASNYKGSEYNLYKLDTVINNWSCLGKDKVIVPKTQVEKKHNGAASSAQEIKIIEEKKLTTEKQKETQLAALPITTAEPKKPIKANTTKYNFNLDVDASEFPEIAVYKGLLFEVGDENKNFNESAYNVVWDDASIKEGTKKGANYLLTLKKGSKKYSLIVYPVFEGKNYDAALKTYQEKYKKYTVLLTKRKEDEKRIEAEYQTKLAELKKQEITLQRKWEEEQKQEFNRMTAEEKIKRVFAINSFGVYNCDHPVSYPNGVSCIANITVQNKKLMCYDIFLVDREKNALFNFYKNPVMNFSFNPESQNILWTVENGVLYWVKPEQFKNINVVNGKAQLEMNKVDKKFKTAEEIKTFFNL